MIRYTWLAVLSWKAPDNMADMTSHRVVNTSRWAGTTTPSTRKHTSENSPCVCVCVCVWVCMCVWVCGCVVIKTCTSLCFYRGNATKDEYDQIQALKSIL